jgi:integrase
VILTIIRSFYKEFDLDLPRTYLKQKQTTETIKDIPSKEDIRFALKHTDLKYKAIITLMLSSGMGASEISSLTYEHFYNSISKYVESDVKDPLNVVEIEEILNKNDVLIVATWNLQRIKTGLNYTTFSSPESIYSILEYLRKYPPENLSSHLFRSQVTREKLTPETIFKYFHRLNLNCGFGMPNRQSFLRSHSLRKYFATTLYKKGIPQLSIDFLLAHKIDNDTSAYFKADIESLKNQYITCIEGLSIESTKTVTLKSPEFIEVMDRLEEMERKYKMLKTQKELDKPKD